MIRSMISERVASPADSASWIADIATGGMVDVVVDVPVGGYRRYVRALSRMI